MTCLLGRDVAQDDPQSSSYPAIDCLQSCLIIDRDHVRLIKSLGVLLDYGISGAYKISGSALKYFAVVRSRFSLKVGGTRHSTEKSSAGGVLNAVRPLE
jgi:hypothetical protein